MKHRIAISAFVLLAISLGGRAAPAEAQSVFSTRGLGFPVDPSDARARGLGGAEAGHGSGEISWTNPAMIVGLVAPGFIASYQYDDFSAETTTGSIFEGNTARFPLILVGLPANERLAFFAGYAALLDQNWRIETPDTFFVGTDTVQVLDQFSSEGGVARMRVGGAYEIFTSLGIGLALDVYTGEVNRTQGRAFENQTAPTCCFLGWTYSGIGYTAGVQWAPTEATGIGASVSYGGTLEATPQDSLGIPRTYDLPLLARIGASGRVGQSTMLALAASWDGWSSLDEAMAEQGGAQDTWSVQGGVEWEGLTIRDRPIPLRLGGRTGVLPFSWSTGSAEQVTESAVTIGTGVLLGGGGTRPDLAFEFGSRGGDGIGIDESYWRFSFSVKVLGR